MATKPMVLMICAALATGASPATGTEVLTGRSEALPGGKVARMIFIPGGIFTMGLADDELPEAQLACVEELGFLQREQAFGLCERIMDLHAEETGTPHEVYISPFAMDRYEITVAEYHACVQAGGCDLSPLVAGDTRSLRDDLPMANVSWYDARSYCSFAGKRLPTEAEWEKAARGDDRRHFPWGNVDSDDRANRGQMAEEVERPLNGPIALDRLPSKLSDSDGSAGPAPPGSYRFGKSPYGVEDMAGNVAEWVGDWFSATGYTNLSHIDPRGAGSGTQKVVRGGSFAEPRFYSRTYHRRRQPPDVGTVTVGFRCARDIR